VSVPTLFVFDRSGKTTSVLYGAPADLHHKRSNSSNRCFDRRRTPPMVDRPE